MVKASIVKLVKLKAILVHFQRRIFKIFFNHEEGNDNEIGQIEGNFCAFSRVKGTMWDFHSWVKWTIQPNMYSSKWSKFSNIQSTWNNDEVWRTHMAHTNFASLFASGEVRDKRVGGSHQTGNHEKIFSRVHNQTYRRAIRAHYIPTQ